MSKHNREPGLYVVFDGPPSHKSGRFVELEDETGAGVGPAIGVDWRKEHVPDFFGGCDYWSLGPFPDPRDRPENATDDRCSRW